jgi:hypothetical protein
MALNDRLGARLRTFCALLPIEDPGAVRAELARWERGAGSPFARVAPTHFARMVVIDELRRDVAAQPDNEVTAPYLMFSAFFDVEPDAYLEAVCDAMGDELYAVLRHCRGCPGDLRSRGATLRAWLARHNVPATQIFAAYPDASLQDVRDALAFREAFRRFAWDLESRRGAKAAFEAFAAGERA